jgi:serine/threonine protein phosphatase PrpC
MTKDQITIQQSLTDWFQRRTTSNATRRVELSSFALSTDIGLFRSENQDRCAVLRTRTKEGRAIVIAAVCDGMGGMEDGKECASIAIASFLYSCAGSTEKITETLLKKASFDANQSVFSNYNGRGGATLSAFCLDNQDKLTGINIGDSRIYKITKGQLTQLSLDDTLAGQFKDRNIEFSHQHELLQHVGIGSDLEPHVLDLGNTKEEEKSRILLSSDGMHFLDINLVESIIQNASEPAKATQRLIELSKWCGGKDNATTIISAEMGALSAFRDKAKKNVIEVWDAYGELQLFTAETTTSKSRITPEPTPTKEKPKKKSTKVKRKKKGKNTQKGQKSRDSQPPTKEKPQLKMTFGDSQG